MRPLSPRTPAQMAGKYPDPLPVNPVEHAKRLARARERAGIRLAATPDLGEAAREWEAHVAAGRIGVPAPAPEGPPPPGTELRLASLEAILAAARGGAR